MKSPSQCLAHVSSPLDLFALLVLDKPLQHLLEVVEEDLLPLLLLLLVPPVLLPHRSLLHLLLFMGLELLPILSLCRCHLHYRKTHRALDVGLLVL